jgi:hypothetical protein
LTGFPAIAAKDSQIERLGEVDEGYRLAREKEVPLALDAFHLQFVPEEVFHLFRALQAKPEPKRIIGIQHPLSLYDALAGGVR